MDKENESLIAEKRIRQLRSAISSENVAVMSKYATLETKKKVVQLLLSDLHLNLHRIYKELNAI